jgi:hypothetical protein
LTFERHYVPDVPKLGNVAISRHAQAQAEVYQVSEDTFHDVLQHGTDRPDGLEVIWREKAGVRLVILRRPQPFQGAMLVKTVYRVKRQETAWRRS